MMQLMFGKICICEIIDFLKRVYCGKKFVIMYAQKGDSVNIMENKELALHAKNIRRNIVKEVYSAQSGHPGGS